MNEYIVMEKDKLEEGKKTFHEDTEKYQKFKLDFKTVASLMSHVQETETVKVGVSLKSEY